MNNGETKKIYSELIKQVIMTADGMPAKVLRSIKTYYASTMTAFMTSWSDLLPFEILSDVRKGCALFHFIYIIDPPYGQTLQRFPGVQVGLRF